MVTWCSRGAAALMALVAVFQGALVLGVPWGAFTQGGGTAETLPTTGRVIAAVSLVVLAVMASAILARAGEGPMASAPRPVVTVLAWFTANYSVIGALLNLITPSSSERLIFGPTSVVIAVLVVVVMVGTRRPSR